MNSASLADNHRAVAAYVERIEESSRSWGMRYSERARHSTETTSMDLLEEFNYAITQIPMPEIDTMRDDAFFLRTLIAQSQYGQAAAAMARVYIRLADDLDGEQFESVDNLLRQVPVRQLPPAVALAFLMGTASLPPGSIPYREDFRKMVRDWYVANRGEEVARETVDTLE